MSKTTDVIYFDTLKAAQDARDKLPDHMQSTARLVYFDRGIAVQFHRSGAYVGQQNPEGHTCPRCPR